MSSVRKAILCITSDAAVRRVLRRTLGPVGEQVDYISQLDEIAQLQDPQPRLMIVDLTSQAVEAVQPRLAARGWTPRILALANWSEQADALAMLDLCRCENLIAQADGVDEAELLVTALKMLGDGDIFGLDKYLAWGVRVRQVGIRTYDEKRAAIEAVSKFAEEVGCRRRLVGRVEIVLDELLMNAMYDAPAAEGGGRSAFVARAVPGGGPVSEESVTLSFGCDGRFLALSVRDAYGALERQTILQHLNRAVAFAGTPLTSTEGGAGLGLYFIMSSVSRFVVNIEPRRATEVICLFDLRRTGRMATPVATSFHIFTVPMTGAPLALTT